MALAPTNPPLTSTALKVVRGSMLAFVLMLGAIVWYLQSTAAPTPVDAEMTRTLRLALLVLVALDVPVILRVRSLQARADTFEAAGRLAIVGWALGEAVAVFGGVIYLLTADPWVYIAGVAVLLGALGMLPVPEAAAREG
jgi:hypothetical protein